MTSPARAQRQTTDRRQQISKKPLDGDLSTYDKLLLLLHKTYPNYSISEFGQAVFAFRQERQTLAGLSLSQIEQGVLDIVQRKSRSEQISADLDPVHDSNLDEEDSTVAAALWKTFRRYREREQQSSNNNEDQCLICLENLNLQKTESFKCHHTFHRNCLEEWFKIERTCPLCRKLLLFADEFPELKRQ